MFYKQTKPSIRLNICVNCTVGLSTFAGKCNIKVWKILLLIVWNLNRKVMVILFATGQDSRTQYYGKYLNEVDCQIIQNEIRFAILKFKMGILLIEWVKISHFCIKLDIREHAGQDFEPEIFFIS